MSSLKDILAAPVTSIPVSTNEAETPTPDFVETLDTILQKKAADWSPTDISMLVVGLRDQRERWNQEQQAGSRKRVPAKNITVKSKSAKKLSFEGLQL